MDYKFGKVHRDGHASSGNLLVIVVRTYYQYLAVQMEQEGVFALKLYVW